MDRKWLPTSSSSYQDLVVLQSLLGLAHDPFVLVFQSAADSASRLVWYDQNGKELGQLPQVGYKDPEVCDGLCLARRVFANLGVTKKVDQNSSKA